MYNEDLNNIPNTLEYEEEDRVAKETQINVKEILGKDIIDLTKPEASEEEDKESEGPMAQIWKMLYENSEKPKIFITPLNYNVFEQDEPHWLETPKVLWKTSNEAALKCEKWLTEQCD